MIRYYCTNISVANDNILTVKKMIIVRTIILKQNVELSLYIGLRINRKHEGC